MLLTPQTKLNWATPTSNRLAHIDIWILPGARTFDLVKRALDFSQNFTQVVCMNNNNKSLETEKKIGFQLRKQMVSV